MAEGDLQLEREWPEGVGRRVAWASDGTAFATSSPTALKLFEADELKAKAGGQGVRLDGLRFGPGDREVLVSPGRYDRDAGTWAPLPPLGKALTGDLQPGVAEGFSIHSGTWGPDGRTLVLYLQFGQPRGLGAPSVSAPAEARIVALDGITGERITLLWEGALTEARSALAVHDALVATAGQVIEVFALPDGVPVARLEGLGTLVRALAFSPDGRRLAAGAAGGAVGVWGTATWEPVATWQAHAGEAAGLSFSAEGTLLATGGSDGVRIWEPGREQPFAGVASEDEITGVAFNPDGTRLLAARPGLDGALLAFRVSL